MNFGELGIEEKLKIFSDGRRVVDYISEVIDDLDSSSGGVATKWPVQPVTLLLLDVNMPILTGMEAMKMIRDKYKQINEKYRAIHDTDRKVVIEPLMCYYSQCSRDMIDTFTTEDEKADLFLQKPLPIKELVSLLRIINVL